MSTIKSIFGRCKGGILAAAAACFITLVYGPLELYFTNRKDFWFAPNVIVPEVLFLFAAALLLCILLLAAADRWAPKLYTLLTGCFVWGTLVCYLHSNFLSGWLPSMDGSAVDWNAYPTQRALSAAVCVAAALFVGFLGWKKWLQNAAFFGGGALTLMLAITVVTLGLGSSSLQGSYYFSTNKELQDYSSDKNFLMFVVDTVDGDVFEQLVNETPEYQEALRDFTYYSNTMSGYAYTELSMSQFLTGQWYEGDVPFETYCTKALNESPFLADLQNRDYRMGFYFGYNFFDKNSGPDRFVNLSLRTSEITTHPAFWRVILRMSCVKNAPFDFKRLGYGLPEKLNGLIQKGPVGFENRFESDNAAFWNYCQTTPVTTTGSDKVFKYIHLDGAHPAFLYGPHLEKVAGTEQATYPNSVGSCLYVIENYLNMLRENDCYDNTAILILSDHGYGENGTDEGRQHSILLAKGFGEHHDYAVNEAPVSFGEMQSICDVLLDGGMSDEISTYRAGDSRERRYMLSSIISTKNNQFTEYMQTGYAGDLNTMQKTGRVYKIVKAYGA
ncbi:MAG: sulfatase-like hydrolase/transferase [Subdoligranulum sp.]|nr:LTA synthase family protein [Subdoligranulum sp.]MDD7266043.1 sulfatase-like hydrolase/transferase [Subdoligranulum sp.]